MKITPYLQKHTRNFCSSFVLLASVLLTGIPVRAQLSCATIQRLETTTFARSNGANVTLTPAAASRNDWTGSGLGTVQQDSTRVYFSDDVDTQKFVNPVKNVNLTGSGAVLQITFAAFNGSLTGVYNGNQSDLRISYGGTLYATIATTNGNGTTGSISFSNGAVNDSTGTATAYNYAMTPNGGAVISLTTAIRLPPTALNSGNVQIFFYPNSNAGGQTYSDDYNVIMVSLKSCPMSFSGTVFNDVNGLTDNAINGTGSNFGGLQVGLYNASGALVPGTTTPVAADGTYTIPYTDTNTGSYTVRLLSTPSGYVNTGEKISSESISDGNPNGITSAMTIVDANTNTNQSGINLGLEAPPNSGGGSNTTVNPGGTNQATVPPNTFSNITASTDSTPGQVAYIRITAFPAGANTITINGISYNSGTFPGAGVLVPANASGNPTQTITVDPAASGATTVTIPFRAVDSAGIASANTGSAVMNFTAISISGNVYNDANGLADNTVNGSGTNAGGLNAVLIDNTTGNVVAISPVAAGGGYSFSGLDGGNYSIEITTNSATVGNAAPAVSLPSGWVSTGEYIGTTAGNDGTVNGILPVGAISASVTNANFGIDRVPDSDPKTTTINSPVLNSFIPLNGSGGNPPAFTGSDPEDQATSGSLSGKTVTITSLPANGQLWYNGSQITSAGTILGNFVPSLLQVKFTGSGYTSLSFAYAYTDAAGVKDPTPAAYSLNWSYALPVQLAGFTVTADNCKAILAWTTKSEKDVKQFVTEHSDDGSFYVAIDSVTAANVPGGSSYRTIYEQLAGIAYYRLRIEDKDGSYNYSNTEKLERNCHSKQAIFIFPTPVGETLNMSGLTAGDNIAIYDAASRQLYTGKMTGNNTAIDVRTFPAGLYYLQAITASGAVSIAQFIKQ